MLMTPTELMKYLKLSNATYFRLLKIGDLPPRIMMTSRLYRFRKEDVDAWVEEKVSQQYQ